MIYHKARNFEGYKFSWFLWLSSNPQNINIKYIPVYHIICVAACMVVYQCIPVYHIICVAACMVVYQCIPVYHRAGGSGPAAPVLAGPVFLKVKMKVYFYK